MSCAFLPLVRFGLTHAKANQPIIGQKSRRSNPLSFSRSLNILNTSWFYVFFSSCWATWSSKNQEGNIFCGCFRSTLDSCLCQGNLLVVCLQSHPKIRSSAEVWAKIRSHSSHKWSVPEFICNCIETTFSNRSQFGCFGPHPSSTTVFTPTQTNHTTNEPEFSSMGLNRAVVKKKTTKTKLLNSNYLKTTHWTVMVLPGFTTKYLKLLQPYRKTYWYSCFP